MLWVLFPIHMTHVISSQKCLWECSTSSRVESITVNFWFQIKAVNHQHFCTWLCLTGMWGIFCQCWKFTHFSSVAVIPFLHYWYPLQTLFCPDCRTLSVKSQSTDWVVLARVFLVARFASEQTSSSTSDCDPWDWFHSNGVNTTAAANTNSSFNHLPPACKDSIPEFSALQHFPSGLPKIPTDTSQCNPQPSIRADVAHQSHHPEIMELEAAAQLTAETPTPPLPSTDVKKALITLKREHQKAGSMQDLKCVSCRLKGCC